MQQGSGRGEKVRTLLRSDRAEIADPLSSMWGATCSVEVRMILDRPGDLQPASDAAGDVDGIRGALVGMDAAEDD